MTITPRASMYFGLTTNKVVSTDYYVVPASGNLLTQSTTPPSTVGAQWIAQAGDLLIATLFSGGASSACIFSSPSLVDNINQSTPWALLFPQTQMPFLSSPVGSFVTFYKVAQGGEAWFQPTFTQTTHTRNTLMIDCFTGWAGTPTLDPSWANDFSTVGYDGSFSTTLDVQYPLPDGAWGNPGNPSLRTSSLVYYASGYTIGSGIGPISSASVNNKANVTVVPLISVSGAQGQTAYALVQDGIDPTQSGNNNYLRVNWANAITSANFMAFAATFYDSYLPGSMLELFR